MKRITLFALLLCITSCEFVSNEPSKEAALEAARRKKYDDRTEEFVRLLDFQKTDGVKRNFFGQDMYTYEYEMRVIVEKHCYRLNLFTGRNNISNFHLKNELQKSIDKDEVFEYKEGDTLTIDGSIVFEKTEKGWKPL